ncbi:MULTISPECIES: thiamine diphosphokinase [unclassified Mesorhizobium]|uniref:thiamine diphosphokinase n=1 Tax=unclassified Mesorhizobium TaxID=325217 RepID=UPI000FC9D0CE|nr:MULTISPECIES: thiamine diphosphokinase [unclassified Mesorhizobium]RUW67389.1 thiamine diphosphokinase [Mesorhizobium sp. M4B.F.Ca.ET.049.02.1.2]RVD15811.1 thiamine diphosphokinase [Mesorhizobium sp. M4B.F.Ca.ET.017.02.2.1]RWC95034.1 MAG: thiamine diphosphokinase [Mesorhizobium sp.]TGV25719.1 thiamine diphosphokinase [Mesorhizobium sp. M4B.F.Ca.ET.143.01.1.1]
MGTFTILLGGDLVRTPRLDSQLAGARVIAADGGIGHARMLGLTPELWVGDFDSVPADLPHDLAAVPRQVFPAEKDKTDGELAIAAALERGATGLVLAGAFGGKRADHAFLHLALAVRLAEAGMSVLLTSGAQEGIPLLPGKAGFDYADGTLFSVLGFSDLSGLSVTGAKWPLDQVEVAFGSSLTISNEVKGRLEIALGHGRALLLAHPYPLPES